MLLYLLLCVMMIPPLAVGSRNNPELAFSADFQLLSDTYRAIYMRTPSALYPEQYVFRWSVCLEYLDAAHKLLL